MEGFIGFTGYHKRDSWDSRVVMRGIHGMHGRRLGVTAARARAAAARRLRTEGCVEGLIGFAGCHGRASWDP